MEVNGQLHLQGKAPGTHWIGDRVGPRAGLDAVAKRKKSHNCTCEELNPGRPACT